MSGQHAPFPASAAPDGAVFVSHSHSDRERGFQYLAPLHREGYEFWYDKALTPTAAWNDQLPDAIERCALFILLVSPVSVERPVVTQELTHAAKHKKPILHIHLEPTPLPSSLDFQLSHIQAIHAHELDFGEAVDRVREQLNGHRVVRVARRPAPPDPVPPRRRPDGMPPPGRPRPFSIFETFADRVPESEALLASVRHQRRGLVGERQLTGEAHENVLVFYGGGGVGKSGLSKQLERWVCGGLPEAGQWGPWPGGPVIPVRWDFNDAAGDVQYADLMRVLRQALAEVPHRFLAFDLGLSAYLEALTTFDRQSLGLTGKAATGVLGSLQIIAARQQAGVPHQLDALTVQRAVGRTLRGEPAELLRDFDIAGFLTACDRIPQGSQAPELVAELVYLLTQEIFYLPEDERPALVFFIDHFERIQRRTGRSHEPGLARIIANLPYGLFVVTGRDKLDWADPRRTDLDDAGPSYWPGLADGSVSDPRQHLLGRLSDEDTRDLYRQYRDQHGWQMSDGLLDKLVLRSAGLPIHIEAVLKLARSLHAQDRAKQFDARDLDQDLPKVVKRLLDVLTPEECNGFRGACVLPFFDVGLASKVGGVAEGDVLRAIRFALVDENRDSRYEYRVHDEIRRLVRQDRSSHGHWSEGDWRAAAERGLVEAKRMITEAHEAEAESDEIQAIALAIRLAYEWDLRDVGLEKAVTDAPSIGLLAPLLPISPDATGPLTEAGALIRFVHAYTLPYEQGIEPLLELGRSSFPMAVSASRFGAYRLRDCERRGEALAVLEKMLKEHPEAAEYTHFQYAITLRGWRRFREALDYAALHVPNELRLRRFAVLVDRQLGDFTSDTQLLREEYRRSLISQRVRLEGDSGFLWVDTCLGRAESARARSTLEDAVRRGARGDVRRCLLVLGSLHLADDALFNQVVERVARGLSGDQSSANTLADLLALRAMLTGDPADALAARESVRPGPRGMEWIRTEVWLEALGYPLDPMPTQWVIPYEQVRRNWLDVAAGIIERAKNGHGSTG